MIKNNADQIPTLYAYIFDIYFDSSLKTIAEHHYLDTFTERVKKYFTSPKVHEQAEYILKICNQFLKGKELE